MLAGMTSSQLTEWAAYFRYKNELHDQAVAEAEKEYKDKADNARLGAEAERQAKQALGRGVAPRM